MPYSDQKKQNKYQREWVAKRRHNYFKDKYCLICQDNKNLQLHHKNPQNKISHNIWSWAKEKRLKELKKCIVLCKECHTDIHIAIQRIHYQENPQDKYNYKQRKFNKQQIINILNLYFNKSFSMRKISKLFNVHHTTISSIVQQKTYNDWTKQWFLMQG